MPTDRSAPYRIYLLTCWLEDANDQADPETWRFRLEEPRSGQRRGYVGVTALVAGLMQVIGNDEDVEEDLP